MKDLSENIVAAGWYLQLISALGDTETLAQMQPK